MSELSFITDFASAPPLEWVVIVTGVASITHCGKRKKQAGSDIRSIRCNTVQRHGNNHLRAIQTIPKMCTMPLLACNLQSAEHLPLVVGSIFLCVWLHFERHAAPI